ncbi:hypothetical protein DN730_09210 [Marinomonas piezotolerans]|uniref:Bacterial transcription activator effector binding domain-containing protein n=1 Tax=Marinomonas piezotolerans TaxID=2213058 RepID=A0A370U9U8_9GAMM|nr:SRPBCC family protein [Marinomonas piezotolerans]RDL44559.1 hypothetical protein DN730_09210 [Marinomonas piezotolerans]
MVIGIITFTLLGIGLLGYMLFTHRSCYVHHTSILQAPPQKLFDQLSQLESWPSWLPWVDYDNTPTITFEESPSTTIESAVISIKSQALGTVTCRVTDYQVNDSLTFQVLSDKLFFGVLDITVSHQLSETGECVIHLTGYNELAFWQRHKQPQQLNQLYADLKLMLVKIQSYVDKDPKYALQIELEDCKQLENVDAVTRPFIVSDQPMSQKMEQGFQDLITSLGPDNPPAGPRFALYETADPSHHYFVGKLGVPIQCFTPCNAHPEKIVLKGLYASLRFQGSYQYLGLGWHILNRYCECHGLKVGNHRPKIEIYEVSPHDTSTPQDYVTILRAPIQ